MKSGERKRYRGLGDILYQAEFITQRQLDAALVHQRRKGGFIGRIVVDLGFARQDDIVQFLIHEFNAFYVNIHQREVPPEVVRLIPPEICLEYFLLPIERLGKLLTVAMADPLDTDALDTVAHACPEMRIKPVLCNWQTLAALTDRLLGGAPAKTGRILEGPWFQRPGRTGKIRPAPDPRGPLQEERRQLAEILVAEHLITPAQLEAALAVQKETGEFLGQILVELDFVQQEVLTALLVRECKIPHLKLLDWDINEDVLRLIPKEICLRHNLLPIDKLGRILTIAMVDPLDADALEEIRKLHPNLRIKPILCNWQHFKTVCERVFAEK